MKKLSLLMMSLFVLNCASSYEQQYTPYPGIDFRIVVKKINFIEERSVNYVIFDLEIINESDLEYNMDLGKIKAKVNGLVTRETNYASIGSVDTGLETLDRGFTANKLYFVIDTLEKLNKIQSLEILDFGITPAPLDHD